MAQSPGQSMMGSARGKSGESTGGFSRGLDSGLPPTSFSNAVIARAARGNLPEDLKAAAQARSGMNLDNVRVRWNSPEPAAVDAEGFARGEEIHLAPGAEKHLGHELWHVVQQKQGRVRKRFRQEGRPINADAHLEREADLMGARLASPSRANAGAAPSLFGGSPGFAPAAAARTMDAPLQLTKGKRKKPEKPAAGAFAEAAPAEDIVVGDVAEEDAFADDESGESDEKVADKKTGKRARKKRNPAPPEVLAQLKQFGATQLGLISKDRGKVFLGPESNKGRRAEQTQRQTAVLTLNRLTNALRRPKPGKPVPAAATAGPAAGPEARGVNPVEVQSILVGGHIFINTNKSAATAHLQKEILAAGSLLNFVRNPAAAADPLDKDAERLVRHQQKLTQALEGKRPHQQLGESGAVQPGESPEDLFHQKLFLDAAATDGATFIDQDNPESFKALLEQLQAEKEQGKYLGGPRVHLVSHKKAGIKDEHAELVLGQFRREHLGAFERPVDSLRPAGTKTPCFGCSVTLTQRDGDRAPDTRNSGALFQESSPIYLEDAAAAVLHAQTKPAAGSLGHRSHVRNSDQADSDTDVAGNEVFPRPLDTVPGADGRVPETINVFRSPGVVGTARRDRLRKGTA